MKPFRLLFLALGLGLFGLVVGQADLKAVVNHVGGLGWAGALGIPAVSLLPFLADTLSWQIVFAPPQPGWGWFTKLWKVRMAASAISKLTPAVGLAGEPIKAVMLKRIYGLPYREGVPSLVLAKTANLIAFVVFVAIGMALAFAGNRLPGGYRLAAEAGFAVLAIGIGVMFAVQRLRMSSALGAWFSRRRLGHRVSRVLHHLNDMDDRLVHAYTRDRARFLAATFLAFLYWILGAVELYLIFWFLGHPVTVGEAIVIAAMVELVRAGTFFIPASIGAEEATLALIVTSITGEAGLGLAVAFVRRYRELLWIGLGLLIAWRISGRSRAADRYAAARDRNRTAVRMTNAATRRLVIDARNRSLTAVRQLLGLTLLQRMIRAARRSGFGNIVILAGTDEVDHLLPLIADEATVTIGPVVPVQNGIVTARVPVDLVGERNWLEQLATETATKGARRTEGTDIFLFDADATPEQIAVADIPALGEPIVFEIPPLRMAVTGDRKPAEQRLLRGLIKDTDGLMSRYFARPISIGLSRRLAPHGVTPNQMTIVSALVGLAAAPFFLSSAPTIQIIGGLLFVAHSVLDGCDGELARLTFRESRLGGLLDFFSDNLVHVAIFGCMAIGWSLAEAASWPLFLGASAVLGTAGSAGAVYWLTLRNKTGAGAVYTSVSDGPSGSLTKVLDALSRRDFIYLVLVLSVFGKANWFLALTAVGAPMFLFLVLWTANRDAQRRRAIVV